MIPTNPSDVSLLVSPSSNMVTADNSSVPLKLTYDSNRSTTVSSNDDDVGDDDEDDNIDDDHDIDDDAVVDRGFQKGRFQQIHSQALPDSCPAFFVIHAITSYLVHTCIY